MMGARLAVVVSTLGLLALPVSGCASRSHVVKQTRTIKDALKPVHERALICAPRQLAEAEAHLDFANYEADAGQTMRARKHLTLAEQRAAEVWEAIKNPHCEGDRDGDGFRDSVDKCPDEPENFDGYQDDDGCPEFDKDGDGIRDDVDKCPLEPEDFDGFQDEDGCPDPDNDGDKILDSVDQCPNEPEDLDGFEDLDGCPDPDNDKDGIPDVRDQCPNEPEDFDGDQDEDGCPDIVTYKNIVVGPTKIELKQKIFFAYNKAKILPKSFDLLNEVADVLVKRPKMKIRIEGHTDIQGSDKYNKKLSQARADAVRTYLIEAGVEPSRLTSVGYGEEQLLDKNDPKGEINRRVEFHIIEQ